MARGGLAGFREQSRAGDPLAVRRLVEATRVFSPAEQEIAEALVREDLAAGGESDYRFLFADRGALLDGYVCYGAIPATQASFDLYWIAVDPGAQRQGLAQRLLAASEARVVSLGGQRLYVDTSGRPDYAPAHAFYRRAGYALLAELPDFYAPRDAKRIYCKGLAQRLAP